MTGCASGIGKACVESLIEQGAAVAALDIDKSITTTFPQAQVLGIRCDVTDMKLLKESISKTIVHFGGIDMIVMNAGIFPKSSMIADMQGDLWDKSIDINMTSHQRLLQLCVPYLEKGFDPAVVIIGSKNCLLYTSPSPRDATLSRMPSSA